MDQIATRSDQSFVAVFEREDKRLPSSKINKTKLHAFFHKAFWRPALDGYHIGGSVHYICWKVKGNDGQYIFNQDLIQTMKSESEINNDPYRMCESHRTSMVTKLELRVTKHKQDKDTYVSVASFWGNAESRTIEYVREVDRIVIDIDGPEHRVLKLKEKKKISKEVQVALGKADFVVDSGAGIQIHYLFDRRQDIYAIQAAYNKIDDAMCKVAEEAITLSGCKVDRLGMNSYYRLPGTYNTRSGTMAKVLEYNDLERLSFDDLALRFGLDAIHPYAKIEGVKREKTPTAERSDKRYQSYYAQLEHDYQLIAKACGKEGKRNNMLYYYLYNVQCVVKDPAVLQRKAEQINDLFSRPLPPSEVCETVQSALREHDKYGGSYSLESQLPKIGLTAADVGELDLWSPLTDDDRQERQKQSKQKHNAKRRAQRQEAKQEVIDEVLRLHSEGVSNAEISRRTGISRPTVIKYVSEAEVTQSCSEDGEETGCKKSDDTYTGRVVAEGDCENCEMKHETGGSGNFNVDASECASPQPYGQRRLIASSIFSFTISTP